MRTIILSSIFALALALLGMAGASAAPVSGNALGNAADQNPIVHQVPCAWRRVCGRRGCVSRRVCWAPRCYTRRVCGPRGCVTRRYCN